MKAVVKVAMVAMAVGALLGCSSSDNKGPPPCPKVSILGDAAQMTRFKPGPGRDVTDVEMHAEVGSFKGSCTYDMDDRIMTVTLQVGIDATRGPSATGNTADLSYFVAVPVFFPKPEAKQVFPVKLTFPDNVNQIRFVDDEVSISFPMRDFKNLASYEVMLGLQIDQSQLDYNRQTKRRL